MEQLLAGYARSLAAAGLCDPDEVLVGGSDAEVVWSRPDPLAPALERIMERLSLAAMLLLRPREPYRSTLGFLAREALARDATITPSDCETRTFLRELRTTASFEEDALTVALRFRKAVVVSDLDGEPAIVAHGALHPAQAFVTASSVGFAAFVKFFGDHLALQRTGRISPEREAAFDRAWAGVRALPESAPALLQGPFEDAAGAREAMCEAGRATVDLGLVDSVFGNVSYRVGDVLHISQTGAPLDAMQGQIDPCPLDGSTCAGLTASSELSAHLDALARTGSRALLHGHPRFAVIMSMDCERRERCPNTDACHLRCSESRTAGGAPIIPGEVGRGPHGLCHTLPPALAGSSAAIVHGHGVFAHDPIDFNGPLQALLDVEKRCMADYVSALKD